MSRGSTDPRTRAIVAGGGTAGHLLPGIAVAGELVRRGWEPDSIHFVGSVRGPEAQAVPDAGFAVTLLPGRGIERRLSLQNIAAMWGLARAAWQALVLVRRLRPDVVLSLGGFASAACAIAAVVWRVPLVIADQNARAGASNRIVARFARGVAVPFADTDLPDATVTGNPVREEILAVGADRDPIASRVALGLPTDRTVIAIFAGSLGSRRINTATYGLAERWADRGDVAIHHVVGARDWDDRPDVARREPCSGKLGNGKLGNGKSGNGKSGDGDPGRLVYQVVRYQDRMDLVLAAADLAVCRAGGTTVAELAIVGVPAVLVPLPIATRDHQRYNAAPLVEAGAAVLVDDDALDTDRLVRELDLVIPKAATMAAAAATLGRPDAAAAVADLVEGAAGPAS